MAVNYKWTDEDIHKIFGQRFVASRKRPAELFRREPLREEYLKTEPGTYRVVIGSKSGHCCFKYTVVNEGGEQICECFYEWDAIRICNALNGVS